MNSLQSHTHELYWNYFNKLSYTIRPEINSNDFGVFWNKLADSNSNFVVAKIIFFERFEFLVRSCECAVACLCPRNSISNVVASVTIHDDIFLKNKIEEM